MAQVNSTLSVRYAFRRRLDGAIVQYAASSAAVRYMGHAPIIEAIENVTAEALLPTNGRSEVAVIRDPRLDEGLVLEQDDGDGAIQVWLESERALSSQLGDA